MNIQILDSWLREFLETDASAKQIADCLSMTSVSVERLTPHKEDFLYDIEITTNRPDLMSVIGIAREAAAILPEFDIKAIFKKPSYNKLSETPQILPLQINNDPKLINRVMAIIMEVEVGQSPEYIKERLETAGIRSLNNIIDITNYVMREIGHPVHVFDYERLGAPILNIRESKKGEIVETLDHKKHNLSDGDIVADNGRGEIVDLLGVMGTANSVVTDNTKKIVYFLDNNEPNHIRRTSMSQGIRTEAAVLNEKGVDPELGNDAFLRGIELYQKLANAKLMSNIIDIYPNKPQKRIISVSFKKINSVIGVLIPETKAVEILNSLGFDAKKEADQIIAGVPTARFTDVSSEEDLIEEIARVHGYHKIPTYLPPLSTAAITNSDQNQFYWEKRVKNALKYWGFTENYTYSMVSDELFEGPIDEAVQIQNHLSTDMVYLRKTLVPSLLQVVRDHKIRDKIQIFELTNVYHKKDNDLPDEILTLALVIKKPGVSFYEIKGIVEMLLIDMGITQVEYHPSHLGGISADIFIDGELAGELEVLEEDLANAELNFEILLKHANLKKKYSPISKFPSAIEDIRLVIPDEITYKQVIETIARQSPLIKNVSLYDMYDNKKTFRIMYQNPEKNMTAGDIMEIRNKIIHSVESELKAQIV